MEEITKTLDFFNQIAIAVVILLIGLTLGLVARKILKKLLQELEVDKTLKKLGKDYPLERRLSNLAAYLIYLITLIIFLNQLGIASLVLYILGGIVLLLGGAIFILGVKDFLPNLMGGLVLYRKGYETGKKIQVNGIKGTIEKLGLLEMEIKTKKGEKIYFPNSLLSKSKVILSD